MERVAKKNTINKWSFALRCQFRNKNSTYQCYWSATKNILNKSLFNGMLLKILNFDLRSENFNILKSQNVFFNF